jgi:diguanylate cyclase (GGDEF)-like protein/PAS domain S-box-containing protein
MELEKIIRDIDNRELISSLIEYTNTGIMVFDDDYRMLYCNRHMASALKIKDVTELYGKYSIIEDTFLHWEFRVFMKEHRDFCMDLAYPVSDRDGEEFTLYGDAEGRYVPLRDGRKEYFLLLVSNIIVVKEENKNAGPANHLERLSGSKSISWYFTKEKGYYFDEMKFTERFGHDLSEFRDMSKYEIILHFMHPDDIEKFENIRKLRSGGFNDYYQFEFRMRHADGSYIWVQSTSRSIPDKEKNTYSIYGILNDIDKQKVTEIERLEKQEIILRTIETAEIISWYYNLNKNNVNFSETAYKVLGRPYNSGNISVKELTEGWIYHEDVPKLFSFIQGFTEKEFLENEAEIRFNHQNGNLVWLSMKGYIRKEHQGGRLKKINGVAMNITSQKAAEEKLTYLAYNDEVTGLYNRKGIQKAIDEIAIDKENLNLMSGLLLDIDRFKMINELFGERVGDQFIIRLSKILAGKCREIDENLIIGRINVDQFVVIYPESRDKKAVERLAVYFLKLIQQTEVFRENAHLRMTASIGVVSCLETEAHNKEFINYLNMAKNIAKERGGNNYYVFSKELETKVLGDYHLVQDIRRGIEKDEFVCYYQPIINAEKSKIVSLEALLRWQHKDRGLLTPFHFIPAAEKSGEISNLGTMVTRKVLMQLKEWQDIPSLKNMKVSVNISSQQIEDKYFAKEMITLARDYNINPEQIAFEITESTLIKETEYAIRNILKLQKNGFLIELDDFGMEYSSLSMLDQLPFDIIKIDQHFVSQLSESPVSFIIINMIYDIAQKYKKRTVVEGVETEEDFQLIRSMGFNEIQGYYFAKPMPVEELKEFVETFNKK